MNVENEYRDFIKKILTKEQIISKIIELKTNIPNGGCKNTNSKTTATIT